MFANIFGSYLVRKKIISDDEFLTIKMEIDADMMSVPEEVIDVEVEETEMTLPVDDATGEVLAEARS